jgi:hypothetical protein
VGNIAGFTCPLFLGYLIDWIKDPNAPNKDGWVRNSQKMTFLTILDMVWSNGSAHLDQNLHEQKRAIFE